MAQIERGRDNAEGRGAMIAELADMMQRGKGHTFADAGDYTYFSFADDTIADTYHVEFRYGADKEGIGNDTDADLHA